MSTAWRSAQSRALKNLRFAVAGDVGDDRHHEEL